MFAWVDELCSRCVFVSVCGLCVSYLSSVSVTVASSSWAESVTSFIVCSSVPLCQHVFTRCHIVHNALGRCFFLNYYYYSLLLSKLLKCCVTSKCVSNNTA